MFSCWWKFNPFTIDLSWVEGKGRVKNVKILWWEKYLKPCFFAQRSTKCFLQYAIVRFRRSIKLLISLLNKTYRQLGQWQTHTDFYQARPPALISELSQVVLFRKFYKIRTNLSPLVPVPVRHEWVQSNIHANQHKSPYSLGDYCTEEVFYQDPE